TLCVVLLAVLATGCTGKDAGETLAGGVCDQLSGKDRDHCYQQIAKFNGDINLCREVEGAGPKTKCVIFVAETTKDAKLCQGLPIVHTGSGAYLYYDCVQYSAVALNDPELCDMLGHDYTDRTGNDLNPKGVDIDTCQYLASSQCGLVGKAGCVATSDLNGNQGARYCLEGELSNGRCIQP
ncbi:MAG TPA: hypothetical protein VLL74_01715, partial [Methanoregula sp.]|nr:hypothetical protein [Methanoregula sp.]